MFDNFKIYTFKRQRDQPNNLVQTRKYTYSTVQKHMQKYNCIKDIKVSSSSQWNFAQICPSIFIYTI